MIEVISKHKPHRVAATATVMMRAEGATIREAKDAALAALGETRDSIFGTSVQINGARVNHFGEFEAEHIAYGALVFVSVYRD